VRLGCLWLWRHPVPGAPVDQLAAADTPPHAAGVRLMPRAVPTWVFANAITSVGWVAADRAIARTQRNLHPGPGGSGAANPPGETAEMRPSGQLADDGSSCGRASS
jgi:hypothetical protein